MKISDENQIFALGAVCGGLLIAMLMVFVVGVVAIRIRYVESSHPNVSHPAPARQSCPCGPRNGSLGAMGVTGAAGDFSESASN